MAGLFAGIGGVERGLQTAGHHSELLCDVDESAQRVLRHRFPDVPLFGDVRALKSLPKVDLVAAGFPCQDLSQAGRTAGIKGAKSGLIGEVFRLVDKAKPTWLLLENVPFMLQLDKGEAMKYLTQELENRGFNWAYRVVDTRAFGLPQRRRRVLVLASKKEDPRHVLLADDVGAPEEGQPYYDKDRTPHLNGSACGFYWTEGLRGLGWAVDATPTLKGGSSVGIPSPPAIVMPTGEIVTPNIRDSERLQGFPADWTAPSVDNPNKRNGPRWRLVGNAVSVPVFRWLGRNLASPKTYNHRDDKVLAARRWPTAAWSMGKGVYESEASPWPKEYQRTPLTEFLKYPTKPLSARATAGFQSRTERAKLRFPEGFLDAVARHLTQQTAREATKSRD